MCEIYSLFSEDYRHCCDFSEPRMLELYYSESYGDPIDNTNGYFVGKKWLNVTVSMWKEDIQKGLLFKQELYNDPRLPHWWLDKIFN